MKIKLYTQGWASFYRPLFYWVLQNFSDLCKEEYYLLMGKKKWVIFQNWVSITFNQIQMIILLFMIDPNFKTEHEKGKK